MLSAVLAGFTALRCLSFCRIARDGAYETVEGVCIEIGRAGLRRQRGVRLLQYDGNECALKLDKRRGLCMGSRYRTYFRQVVAARGCSRSDYQWSGLSARSN